MKDEGPFILEWLAWHKAVGVTDFIVFTNDCTDGTDRMLDHLDQRGLVRHLPNPAVLNGDGYFQPTALAYLHHMGTFKTADFVISMDVDEFINIRAGQGHFDDLLAATGPFDALSMTEINHGSNRKTTFEPGWITAQFPQHETETPGKYKSRRGVKTITRMGPLLAKLRNHRPDFCKDGPAPHWIDGSGRPLASLATDASENGLDCRGTYGLVSLDHFALRSLDSYMMKMLRGDVVVKDKKVGRTYWRQRNRNTDTTSDLTRFTPEARAWYDKHLATDATLMALHNAACAHHVARIAMLPTIPDLAERRDWILREAW